MLSKLQYISQGVTANEQLYNIQQALDAGCQWIQLRFKGAGAEELTILAEQIKRLCADSNATFIINDHPHIAKIVDADGVHLGLTDMSISKAKKMIGESKIIGGTANTLEHVRQRVEDGCTYIGLGPFRFTATKENLSPVLGLEGYEKIINEYTTMCIRHPTPFSGVGRLSPHPETYLKKYSAIPIYAIGGITIADVAALMQTGIYGIAVSAMISHYADKKLLIQQLNKLLYEQINDRQ